MKYDVKLIKTREMFCEESAIATYAKWKNRNCEMMYLGMCNFSFDYENADKERKVGKYLDCGYSVKDVYEAAEKYHGIKVESCFFKQGEVPSQIFSELLSKEIICTVMLPFSCCSWTEGGEDKDEDNFVMLIGVEKDYFYCLDIHMNDPEVHTLSFDEVDRAYQTNEPKCYETYNIVSDEKKDCSVSDFVEYMRNSDYFLNGDAKQKEIDKLIQGIETYFDLEEEIKGEPFRFYIPILINTTHILRGRLLLAETFEFMYRLNGEVATKTLAIEFGILGAAWKDIRTMLDKMVVKISLSNRKVDLTRFNTKLAANLKDVLDEERCFIQSLCKGELQILDEYDVQDEFDNVADFGDIVECDLKSYFNNNSFASSAENIEKSDFTGHNEFWIEKSIVNDGVDISIGGYKSFICKNFDGNDNILCDNQKIAVKKAKYKKMVIVGCSEWGDGSGVIEVNYSGKSKKVFMTMPDWYPYSITNEVSWVGNAVNYEGVIQERAIYSHVYTLDGNFELEYIVLPKSVNMHVFKILLIK